MLYHVSYINKLICILFVSQSSYAFWQKNDMLLKWSIVISTSKAAEQRKVYYLKDTALLCDAFLNRLRVSAKKQTNKQNNNNNKKHIIPLSKNTSQLADQRKHLELISNVKSSSALSYLLTVLFLRLFFF